MDQYDVANYEGLMLPIITEVRIEIVFDRDRGQHHLRIPEWKTKGHQNPNLINWSDSVTHGNSKESCLHLTLSRQLVRKLRKVCTTKIEVSISFYLGQSENMENPEPHLASWNAHKCSAMLLILWFRAEQHLSHQSGHVEVSPLTSSRPQRRTCIPYASHWIIMEMYQG